MNATPTNRTTRAQLYRNAAKLMEDGNDCARGSCCWAIGLTKDPGVMIFHGEDDADCNAMRRIFRPRGGTGFWMSDIGDNEDECHDGRILALCFMAAMVEAGDA